ncbi:pleckstrin homology domain-containing family A member 5 isoform X2 [Oncorhynchus tshawytscha]|uniref:pleckstrin homology domain-containing family A member 5 isoform X2 n=1 Tax=Oncorhynchus tshawytscha TaxID=74940 RepID=UPI001C3C4822|nr:pleckstrin homology domain-containing family A member 5 isoform X2 [Oncorhynchus tshawytscha]
MAADLHPEWISRLPSSWSYGVTRDGRVFFINEEAKSTTWLHPVSGEAVITGHRKTPDLPTGWEEGFSFEGARCFINHNERKVTCKHPVSGCPSQDNCIFVVNEQSAPKAPANEKERPLSTMSSEASNYTGSSDYATHQSSPAARPSRSSKKIHNFGKRSNSIRRNPNALVVKSNWLYKQDSTGMKLWKKRWFVLSDMCLYYYRDEKEEGILGSILLPSFRISMLSVDDHINRKYAFKATHPNMRTYYFCTDAAKDMESWMKVMTDAALVHSEPIRSRSLKVEQCGPQDVSNHVTQNHRPVLTRPEIQNNERNRTEADREHHTIAAVTTVTTVTAEEEEDRKQRDAERYGFQKEGAERDRPLTKINSIKLEPDQASAVPADITPDGPYRAPQVNGAGDQSPGEMMTNPQPHRTPSIQGSMTPTTPTPQYPHGEPEPRTLTRTNSMQQLEQWVRTQRVRNQDDDTHSIMSYQTLPRNMPSHRAPPAMPHYGDPGYRTLPRNSMARPDSICSMSPSMYDQAMGLGLGLSSADKRRSMRDDTMWQLYEWQQRQAYTPTRPMSSTPRPYGTLPSPKTMINLSEHQGHGHHSIPPSPSHGSLSMYGGYSPLHFSYNPSSSRSEVAFPVYRGDVTTDRRHRTPHLNQYAYPPERRSMPAGIPVQTITAQSLQGKTPEELTLLLIKLRRQQADLNSVREHTVAQLMQLNLDGGHNPKNDILSHHLQRNLMYLDNQMSSHVKENQPLIVMIHTLIENSAPRPQLYQHHVRMSPEDHREHAYMCSPEEVDIDAKLSRLCEQDKVVRIREDKLQQLHREKHTLETALLSASQEIEMSADNPAAVHSVIQQRDVLQSGLLSTCRELSRVNTELERSWREYEKLEGDVSLAKDNLLEQLEALGSPQTEPPSHQHVHIQKELWRIQDVMEALNKNKTQRHTDTQGHYGSTPISNIHKSEEEVEDLSAPPRPPLPQAYEPNSPAVPPLPSRVASSGRPAPPPPPHRSPEDRDRKAGQRNGTGPDYRLYKSEPELTTVTEVDETNGEDRSEQSDRDPANTKGMSYPVGIVPPRTKSPNMPNSSSINSYVTLRRGGRPDPRMERPHSAVEQLSGGAVEKDSGRSRMSVEEQLERIRRHQQGALREKKKGLHILAGSSCNSPQDYTTHSHSTTSTPSRSPSFTKENPFRSMQQNRRQRGEGMSSDILELEASLREQEVVREQETPAEEIARLKEATHTDHYNMDRELSVPEKVLIPERYVESDPEESLSPEQEADKQKKVDRIKALIAKNSMQNVLSPPGPEKEAEEETTAQDQEKMINISYELAAEASKRSKLVAVHSLSSSSPPPEPQPSSSPPPNTQPPPQLTDGSHFICV